ncbi:MAG TPA: nuclear transport factor 2 family protein [Fimbriimonadaceae bacterium]|nr:nuclear transport factor 2 family protein [Fimbriimonadaceae bacterium]
MLIGVVALLLGGSNAVEAQLRIRYQAWDAAYVREDDEALGALLHPGFRIVTNSGCTVSRKTYLAGIGKGKPPVEYRTELLRAERSGNRAWAWTEETSRRAQGQRHVHRYRDTWTLSKGHWLLRESKTLSED